VSDKVSHVREQGIDPIGCVFEDGGVRITDNLS